MILDGNNDWVDKWRPVLEAGDIVVILFASLAHKKEGKNDVLALGCKLAFVLLNSIPAFIAF